MSDATNLRFADLEPVGPGTPTGRYLRMYWQPVMRSQDLARGRAKPLEILGEKFTIYRGEDGASRLTEFRCPHRGAQMSLGWVEGDSLRCRYHGWKFDGSGQCVEQPGVNRPFCERIKLKTYPTREYLGLIHAFLGEGDPPPFRRYPDMDAPGVVISDPPEILPCSFWNRMDNDNAHVPWVHRATAERAKRNNVKERDAHFALREETIEVTDFGFMSKRRVQGQSDDFLGKGRVSYLFMPNVRMLWARSRTKGFESRGLWDTFLFWLIPINDQSFIAFDITHTPLQGAEAEAYVQSRLAREDDAKTRFEYAEKVLAGELTLEELPDDMNAYTSFDIEDYVTQVGQGPIAGRSKENLALTDPKLVVFRRLWLREVTAMLEGQSLTDWKIPSKPMQNETDA